MEEPNEMKTVKRSLLFLLGIGLTCSLYAQDHLILMDKTGAEHTFPISEIRKMTFPTGTLELMKSDGTTASFGIAEIRKMTFGAAITHVPPLFVKSGSNIQVYPNPASSELSVMLEAPDNSPAQFQIIDLNGRILIQETINMHPGSNLNSIDVNDLHEGLYLLRIKTSKAIETTKFLKD